MFCYFMLNYDEIPTSDIYVSYKYFIITVIQEMESLTCCNLYHNCLESVKELQKVPRSILIVISVTIVYN